jgi:class 3 adenylate cyclase
MVFVNEIAEIVHGTVDHYSGSANKNIGDAFLLVWKYSEDCYINDVRSIYLWLGRSKIEKGQEE